MGVAACSDHDENDDDEDDVDGDVGFEFDVNDCTTSRCVIR